MIPKEPLICFVVKMQHAICTYRIWSLKLTSSSAAKIVRGYIAPRKSKRSRVRHGQNIGKECWKHEISKAKPMYLDVKMKEATFHL